MTFKEFGLFAAALKTYYPKEQNLIPTKQALDLWFNQLQDIPYQVAVASLNKWVSLNKWSPTIADIRETALSVSNGDLGDYGDAWEEVLKAIKRYGSFRPEEALASMSPLARKATERIGFLNICMSENIAADRANFRMIYEQLAEREKKDAQLPQALRDVIAGIQQNTLEDKKNECLPG